MTPVPTAPLPGSMTVPPLFGWENILIVLIVLLALAAAFFLAAVAGTDADSRSEWQAGLDARSRERLDPAEQLSDRSAEQLRTPSDA